MICLILIQCQHRNDENGSELFNTIIQLIDEHRFIVNNLNDYYTLDLLFKTCNNRIYFEPKHFERILNYVCDLLNSVS